MNSQKPNTIEISKVLQKILEAAQGRFSPHPVEMCSFSGVEGADENDFLIRTGRDHLPGKYLYAYLSWQDASVVLREKNYHDWEFASQFQIYYGASSSGYPNLCRRHHYFSAIPPVHQVLGEGDGSDIWQIGDKLGGVVNAAYAGLCRWFNQNTEDGSEFVEEPSMDNLIAIEGAIKNRFYKLKNEKSKNKNSNTHNFEEMVCSLRKMRRELEGKILDHLTKAHDELKLECGVGGPDGAWANFGSHKVEKLAKFTEIRRQDRLDALIKGLHNLYQNEISWYFGFDSLVHLLRGMPEEHAAKVKWMKQTVALGSAEHPVARSMLRGAYLGYVVERPLPHAPIGNTVLRWPRSADIPLHPRVVATARKYKSSILGVPLETTGLGWQQHDQATGACASQALWSALQSRVYENQSTPSSPVITILANKFHSAGQRTFPSLGLTCHNLAEAIRHQEGLAPLVIDGDLPDVRAGVFSLEEFNFLCTSLLYGGFPVILFGDRSEHDDRHAICLTGFRSEGFDKLPDTGVTCVSSDSCVKTYYGHDVSLGINVRFKVFPGFRAVKGESHSSDKKEYFAILRYYGPVSEPSVEKIMRIAGLDPGSVSGDVIKAVEAVINEKKSDIKKGNDIYEILEKLKATESCKIGKVNDFEPGNIVVAFPRQIRSDPRLFLRTANDKLTILTFAAIHLSGFFISRSDKTRQIFWPYKQPLRSLVYSIRYISLSDYLGTSLLRILPPDPMIVSKVRRRILEGVRHMPEFIGVLRVGILFDRENEQKNGPELTHPLMDIIYDTSETDGNAEVFATIKFLEIAADIILLSKRQAEDYISRFNEVKKLAGESLNKFSPQDLEKLKHFGTEICAFDENFEPEYLGADKPEFLVDFLLSNGRFN